MNRLFFVLFLTAITSFTLPSFAASSNTTHSAPAVSSNRTTTQTVKPNGQQIRFIYKLLPKIEAANSQITADRTQLLKIKQQYNHQIPLSNNDLLWLKKLAGNYNVKDSATSDANIEQVLQQLKNRVDIIPPALVLAQAANESAWGRSRFATQGNNLFGQWCSRAGCGLVPLRRPEGASYEVRKFNSIQASIVSYINNLNSHGAYSQLRKIRAQMRQSGTALSGLQLAKGLSAYSARGNGYISIIQKIIINYHLVQLVENYQRS